MNPTSTNFQCRTHPQREAAARCASCGEFFCRECVTEHDLQMLCAPCFRQVGEEIKRPKKQRTWLMPLAASLQLLLALVLVWLTFYMVGRLIMAVPSDFHEGTLWNEIQPGGER